jgi:putative transcriptional regulator
MDAMKNKKPAKSPSFREQMAHSMAELQGMIDRGESPSGNGRLTVRRIHVSEPGEYDAKAVRTARARLNVSQPVFAQLLGISAVLVRSWERGARSPAPIARRLLDQVQDDPKHFLSLVRYG